LGFFVNFFYEFGLMTLRKLIFLSLFAGFDRDRCAASKPIGKSRKKTSGIRGLLGFSADESDGPKSRFASKEPSHDAGLQIDAINQVSYTRHSWANWEKTRQKLDSQKKYREIDASYLCSPQQFDKF
jgi:hypothetical protein